MTPTVAVLIEAFGWRTALGITGLSAGTVIFLAALFLVRNQPKSNDIQGFDEFDLQTVSSSSGSEQGVLLSDPEPDGLQWTFRPLSKNRNFWFVSIGCGLLLASDQAILISQVPYLQDSGVSLSAAAFFAACLTLSAVGGKLLVGFLSDRFDIRRLLGVIVLCHCALLIVLIVQPDYWVLVGVASTFGVAVGGVFPVWLGLTARVFGAKSYGTIMGVMALVMQPISVVAIRFIGEVRDRTGSYDIGFGVLILVVILAYFVVAMVTFPESERN